MKLLTTIIALFSAFLPAGAQLSTGDAQSFNDGWLFAKADTCAMSAPDYDDTSWRCLSVPHDWSIEGPASPYLNSCTGYLPGGVAWYRKHFTVTDGLPVHYILFEGVYNRSDVYLNGHLLGHRPNGYVSFYYDLSPWLVEGDNILAVRVDHSREADSRWYTGSGIYRDVWLVGCNGNHYEPWGLGWSATDISDSRAVVNVELSAVNRTGATTRGLTSVVTLCDADGRQVAKTAKKTVPGSKETLSLNIAKPHRWNLDDPYLYTLTAVLTEDGKVVDTATTRVGLRTLDFDPDRGFAINGRNTKIKGVCLHHDAGCLGAAVPREVWKRRLANLKEMGANAIRMSHNPQAPCVYDLCDELGLLVMDEGSDEWEFPKRKWVEGWNRGTPSYDGTYDFFEEWIDRDIADMVRRDRNHPSVFMWSVGNEVDYPNDPYSHPVLDGSTINQPMFGGYNPDAPDAMRIGRIAKRIAGVIRSIDTSRPVTGALAGVVMSNQTEYPQAVDVVGYNYTEDRYALDHGQYPDRIIYGSENGHGYAQWKAVRDNDYISGQFIWTGTDYLGESGAWPSRGLHTGLLDFGSNLKPRGKFRSSLWSEKPVAWLGTYKVHPRFKDYMSIDAPGVWNYEAGDTVRVVLYTNAATARLKLDGEEYGIAKPFDDNAGMIRWDVPYRPGRLTAEAMDVAGHIIATDTLRTSGLPYALTAESDIRELSPGRRVAHVTVKAVDAEGNHVPLADNSVTCRVQGCARLLGLEGSDNSDMTDHADNRERLYGGQLLAYVMLDANAGSREATVTFTSPMLKSASVKLTVH